MSRKGGGGRGGRGGYHHDSDDYDEEDSFISGMRQQEVSVYLGMATALAVTIAVANYYLY